MVQLEKRFDIFEEVFNPPPFGVADDQRLRSSFLVIGDQADQLAGIEQFDHEQLQWLRAIGDMYVGIRHVLALAEFFVSAVGHRLQLFDDGLVILGDGDEFRLRHLQKLGEELALEELTVEHQGEPRGAADDRPYLINEGWKDLERVLVSQVHEVIDRVLGVLVLGGHGAPALHRLLLGAVVTLGQLLISEILGDVDVDVDDPAADHAEPLQDPGGLQLDFI